MIRLNLLEIAEAVNGKLVNDAWAGIEVSGSVETDSRLIGEGSLFVAKPGEFTDGHNFVEQAMHAGAVAAIVQRELPIDFPQILVGDSVLAIGLLAKSVLATIRAQTGLRVIGVTGSNGKTTTKNMLREILSKFGETIAPIESYNNEVGAPYSILRCTAETDFLVVEMGADGLGSIAYLTDIAKPDVAIELKVGLAHVGEFGGIETTAKIKAELLEGLDPSAVAILNFDDGYVREMAEHCGNRKFWFGTASGSDLRADEVSLDLAGTSFTAHWADGQSRRVTLQILGEHHIMNALASLSAAEVLGLDREISVAALEAMPLAERWRMQVTRLPNGIHVINDAYNASPDSTKAALQTLAHIGRGKHRTIAVLGEMAELGAFSREQHDAIGRIVVRLNIDQLVVVGEGAKLIHLGAMQEGSWDGESIYFDSASDAEAHLRGMLEPNDLLLVKSSKSANLRHLGDRLCDVSTEVGS